VSRLPLYKALDFRATRLPAGERRALQAERLRNMVAYVHASTGFWRRKLDAAGLDPASVTGLDDLPAIPFCDKQELQRNQREHPPFGDYTGSDPSTWVRCFATSGTTGRPLRRVYSARDWEHALAVFRRTVPVGPGDRVVMLGPTDGLLGPTASVEGQSACGALVIHAARYDTRGKLALIEEVRPAVVVGSASYLLHLADVAQAEGADLTALGLKFITSVGEPGAAIEATAKRLTAAWGAPVVDGFGLTEIFPLGGGCPANAAIHLPNDMVIAEICDPETGAALAPGQPGELVLTNIVGDTQPLLRYRTGDLARLESEEACACGHLGPRLARSIEGRIDDMIWYRGMNLFPAAFDEALHAHPGPGRVTNYRIVLQGTSAKPRLVVEIEAEGAPAAELAQALEPALHERLGVRADVQCLAPGTLPPPDPGRKARRVLDQRS